MGVMRTLPLVLVQMMSRLCFEIVQMMRRYESESESAWRRDGARRPHSDGACAAQSGDTLALARPRGPSKHDRPLARA